ncbi:MAG: aspartate--tRNA(Asn) ligase [Firmicutes bacterium]|mgnify:CR=1 FL=1|nr:aspartate--tRNA(Asn) ligase [Bacillota bacterium]
MKRVLVKELAQKLGEEVLVQGWVFRWRRLSKINFILLRDRSGIIQVSVDPALVAGLHISLESVMEIEGIVQQEPRAPEGYEVVARKVELLAPASGLPFNVNAPNLKVNLEGILDHRVLSLRHEKINPVFRIQAALVQSFQRFLDQEDFLQVFTPKIVGAGTEGGTELFSLQYFEEEAFLAQSPQFYKQMLVGAGYERVYEVGQVYRAEKHATSRHLNEYVSLDLEMGFIADEHDLMDLQNRLLAFMFSRLKEDCRQELRALGVQLKPVGHIPRVPLQEAVEILDREFGKKLEGFDLDPEGERLLSGYFLQHTGSEFVYVTDYHQDHRPMYTMPKKNNLTASFDLLFKGLEITTGGQRIHDYALLKANMEKKGLDPKDFSSYLDSFKWGLPPHGGLAIGLERLTAQIVGLANVREASLFPRDRHRLTP